MRNGGAADERRIRARRLANGPIKAKDDLGGGFGAVMEMPAVLCNHIGDFIAPAAQNILGGAIELDKLIAPIHEAAGGAANVFQHLGMRGIQEIGVIG